MTISTSSSLLINEAPLQVLPSLAVALKNINEAIMLQQIQYWLQNQKMSIKGVSGFTTPLMNGTSNFHGLLIGV